MLAGLLKGLRSTALPRSSLLATQVLESSPVSGYNLLLGSLLQQARGKKTARLDVGLKSWKPVTPGLRGRITTTRGDLWKGRPFKPLVEGLSRTGGRNNHGRITSYHRGGGAKRLYRLIDLKRHLSSAPATVQRIEYDPNRSARIALLQHAPVTADDKPRLSYILAPQQMAAGDQVQSSLAAPIRPGNSKPLHALPVGTAVHNVELQPGRGGQLVRAAGTAALLISKGADGKAVLRLPSGEQKAVLLNCMATIGTLSNPQHKNTKRGKAGASRWLGRRPVVRGVAMNPVDHPHGGGRGKSKGRISQTPWGKPTKGFRTRDNPRTDASIRQSRRLAGRRG